MKRSNRLVILVGVLLAVLAFVAIVILLNQREEAVAPEEITETVLVATQDIAIGDPVTPNVVEEREINPEAIQGTALGSTSAVAGQPALFAVPAGSQVNGEVIGVGTGVAVNIAAQLDVGEKAVTFQVDRATGVDLLIKPGDSIDIVISREIPVLQETADSAANVDENAPQRLEPVVGLEGPDRRSVKAILQDKRVLYVSDTRAIEREAQDTNGDGVVDETDVQAELAADIAIIVFAGTDQDAELIKFAQNDFSEFGFLTAIIRHAEDDAIEETLGITIDQLVSEYGVRIPSIVEQLNEEAAP